MTKEEVQALKDYLEYLTGTGPVFTFKSFIFILWCVFAFTSSLGLLICATKLGDQPQHLNAWLVSEAIAAGYYPVFGVLLATGTKTNKTLLRMRGKGPAAIGKKNVDERYIAELEQEVLSD